MNLKSPIATRRSAPETFRPGRGFAAAVLPLIAAALSSTPLPAQTSTSAVPGFITYQGKVSNADGSLVGATSGGAAAPTSRTVTFRIWSHQSNSTVNDLVYSEQQTVTISQGEFSVLIGQGTPVSGTPLGYSEAPKGPSSSFNVGSPSVFGGSLRYLGVTIDDGNTGTLDPEISPRQQLVTSAFAFRAKYAESVGSNGVNVLNVLDSGNVGIGASNPAAKLDVAGNVRAGGVANASFVLANADNNPIGAVGIASSAGAFSTDAAINDVVVRASAGKLLLQSGTGASALTIGTNNAVGIGVTTPGAAGSTWAKSLLSVNGNIALRGDGTGANSWINQRLLFGGDGTGYLLNFASVNNTGTLNSAVMTLSDLGRVGIGSTSPSARLDVNGAIMVNSGIGNTSARPAVGASRISGEINSYSVSTPAGDDGFLRLSAGGGTNSSSKTFIDLTGYSTVADMNANIRFGTSGTERMRISSAGNVVIGTATATSNKLNVFGLVDTDNYTTEGQHNMQFRIANGQGTLGTRAMEIGLLKGGMGVIQVNESGVGYNHLLLQPTAGLVGINTGGAAPYRAQLEVIGGPVHSSLYGPYINSGGVGAAVTHGAHQVSIHSSHSIWLGGTLIVTSDERMKTILSRSDAVTDLATLRGIEITNFKYKDTIGRGDAVQKKVIAQQVERVFPQAISRQTDSVPDIYTQTVYRDGWIHLANDLKPGERVRLIDEKANGVYEVLEAKPDRFRTAFVPNTDKIFVFGREVKDFRTVDYDAIAMLNVSATQELARENEALKKRVAELEAKDRARDAKLASIERLLQANQTVMAAPAKTTTSNNGQE